MAGEVQLFHFLAQGGGRVLQLLDFVDALGARFLLDALHIEDLVFKFLAERGDGFFQLPNLKLCIPQVIRLCGG